MSGLQFLWNLSEGKDPKVGKRVLVIGGGNTAIDAARSAIRLGSDVTMLYRRSKAEMPASEEEIAEAEREGVKMEMLTAPLAVIVKNARVAGLECQKMELGAPDETGRRRPVPVEGSKMVLDADTVIGAIGENVDTSIIPSAMGLTAGSIATNIGGRTDWQNVFAGGDATMQSRTVVDAIGGAKRSAIAMDCFLRGENFENIFDKICVADTDAVLMSRYIEYRTGIAHPVSTTSETEKLNEIVKFDELNPAYFQESAPLDTPSISVNERLSNNAFKEVHRPPTETEKFGELARCFHCGRCTECDNCFIYCPDVAIAKKTKGFDIDLFFCKGCGVCAVECPRAALRMTEEPTELE
jgi:formate dehydrogenase major subunit